MHKQSYAGFRWFDIEDLEKISVEVKTKGHGKILVGTSTGRADVCSIEVTKSKKWTSFEAKAHAQNGVCPLYFTWTGTEGLDFNSFTLTA